MKRKNEWQIIANLRSASATHLTSPTGWTPPVDTAQCHNCAVIVFPDYQTGRKEAKMKSKNRQEFSQGWLDLNQRNAGVKVLCLTAWLHPYSSSICGKIIFNRLIVYINTNKQYQRPVLVYSQCSYCNITAPYLTVRFAHYFPHMALSFSVR